MRDIPNIEGFWRSDQHPDLPWPEPIADWHRRKAFIEALDILETSAERITYRGLSLCRLCGCHNGSETLVFDDWAWPVGYRHYIVEHLVRPSPAFERFVLSHPSV